MHSSPLAAPAAAPAGKPRYRPGSLTAGEQRLQRPAAAVKSSCSIARLQGQERRFAPFAGVTLKLSRANCSSTAILWLAEWGRWPVVEAVRG